MIHLLNTHALTIQPARSTLLCFSSIETHVGECASRLDTRFECVVGADFGKVCEDEQVKWRSNKSELQLSKRVETSLFTESCPISSFESGYFFVD